MPNCFACFAIGDNPIEMTAHSLAVLYHVTWVDLSTPLVLAVSKPASPCTPRYRTFRDNKLRQMLQCWEPQSGDAVET